MTPRENTYREHTDANCLITNHFENTAGLKALPNSKITSNSSEEWFVLRDLKRSNAKTRAWQELTDAGFEVFTPIKPEIRQRERREVAVIPDLLFVHSTRTALDPVIRRTPTLQYRFLKGAPAGTPMTVRADDMNRFITLVRAAKQVEYLTPEQLTPEMIGSSVRIVCDGPLNGLTATLLALPGSKSRRILAAIPGLLSAALTLTPIALQPLP